MTETQSLVHSFLRKERGYPDNSIVHESRIDDDGILIPDVTIINPDTQEQLALIDVQRGKSQIDTAISMSFLQTYRQVIAEPVQFFFVEPDDRAPSKVRFYRLTNQDSLEPLSEDEFPTFEALVGNRVASSRREVSSKRKQATDQFMLICTVLAIGALVLAIVDVFWRVLTPERLILLGVAVGLVILPHSAKLKALGIEWERLHRPHERSSSKTRTEEPTSPR